MKVQFVISYGLIQMTDVVGVSHLEEPDTPLAKISVSNLTIQMT